MKSALVPMNMSLKSLNSALLLGFFDQDLQLLDAEAVLGKAVKRLEQGGKQQAAAAEEFGVVDFTICRLVLLRTPGVFHHGFPHFFGCFLLTCVVGFLMFFFVYFYLGVVMKSWGLTWKKVRFDDE